MTSENRAPSTRACRSTMFTPCAARQPAIPWMLPGVIVAQDRQDEPLAAAATGRLGLGLRASITATVRSNRLPRSVIAAASCLGSLRLGELDRQDDREVAPHDGLAQLEDVPALVAERPRHREDDPHPVGRRDRHDVMCA